MSTLQIDLDQDTDAALTALATSRGMTPAALVAEFVARYVKIYEPLPPVDAPAARNGDDVPDPLDAIVGSVDIDPDDQYPKVPPDALDVLVGKYDAESGDIDDVVYGR